MLEANKLKVSKTDGDYLYINILDFKDKEEQSIIYQKVKLLIKEWETKRRVF